MLNVITTPFTEEQITNSVAAAKALRRAYVAAEASGSVDWDAVDLAHELACAAFPDDGPFLAEEPHHD